MWYEVGICLHSFLCGYQHCFCLAPAPQQPFAACPTLLRTSAPAPPALPGCTFSSENSSFPVHQVFHLLSVSPGDSWLCGVGQCPSLKHRAALASALNPRLLLLPLEARHSGAATILLSGRTVLCDSISLQVESCSRGVWEPTTYWGNSTFTSVHPAVDSLADLRVMSKGGVSFIPLLPRLVISRSWSGHRTLWRNEAPWGGLGSTAQSLHGFFSQALAMVPLLPGPLPSNPCTRQDRQGFPGTWSAADHLLPPTAGACVCFGEENAAALLLPGPGSGHPVERDTEDCPVRSSLLPHRWW